MTILQKISSRKSSNEITNFLFKNQDKINLKLAKFIQYWAPNAFRKVESQKVFFIARDMIIFAELILKKLSNNRVDAIEIALIIYQVTLEVYTPVKYPQNWAMLQSYLGNMYRDRAFDDPTKNFKQAIFHYRMALEVLTKDQYPYRWGIIQRDLGMLHAYNLQPGQDHKLIAAITHYRRALSVHKADDFPEDWAANHNNLGEAYFRLEVGSKSSNIELAVEHFRQSLTIYNCVNFAYPWSMVNNNLGNAFKLRIKGEKRDNLTKAITYYRKALSVQTLEKSPYNWAMLQNNLAGAYYNLACTEDLSGKSNQKHQDNLQQALDCLQKALVVYKESDFPQQWQDIQNNLSNIYQLQTRS
ncbi:hypothetical protein Xen7305DRAFT_00018140 [Xenococcus sp. PCC 7305]|nr:hypothetical protein Xen7305DRAFT_00018140 [Xenococcus sp. PCC 7305]